MARWWESWRQVTAAEDSPWYEPEIDRHFMDYPTGNRAVYRFDAENAQRVEDVRNNVHHQTGIGRPGRGPRGSMDWGRLETGHNVEVNLDYPSHTWYSAISPPSHPHHATSDVAFLHLGQHDEDVPAMLRKRFMHPDVQQYLRNTMDR